MEIMRQGSLSFSVMKVFVSIFHILRKMMELKTSVSSLANDDDHRKNDESFN
jgi:hypothetical protein